MAPSPAPWAVLGDVLWCLGLGCLLAGVRDAVRLALGEGALRCFFRDIAAFAAAAVLVCGFAAGASAGGLARWYMSAALLLGAVCWHWTVQPAVHRCAAAAAACLLAPLHAVEKTAVKPLKKRLAAARSRRRERTGAIASQKKDYRFKIGTIGEKKPEDWIVVENQHEPLVDRKTFDIVQRKLKSRQRPRQTGEISLFAGLIKCGECGKSLTIRYTNDKHPKQIYSCKTYNAYGKQHCTQHRVEYDTLYSLVLNKIRECARAALMDGEAVAGKLTDTCEAEQKGQREALERSLTKDEERIDVLEKMVLRLYEDMVAGRISEANFNLLMEKTQAEQAELKAKVEEGRKKLADEIRLACDARQWVEAIQEYADITELDAATLNRLIKEIVVHESIDSDKTRHISIEIHFNLKPIPEVEQVTA